MAEMAREAGALLMDSFRRHIGYEYKGDVDLVTKRTASRRRSSQSEFAHSGRSMT